jgi:F-type H+-transporting ATPase subunit c
MNVERTIIIGCSVLGAGIACLGAALAAGAGNGLIGTKALEGMTRQPELADKLLINSLIYIGLVEAVPIISIVIAIILVLANPFI